MNGSFSGHIVERDVLRREPACASLPRGVGGARPAPDPGFQELLSPRRNQRPWEGDPGTRVCRSQKGESHVEMDEAA